MPGRFDYTLQVNQGQVIPSGPLELAGETDVEVYVWVIQAQGDGAGALFVGEAKPSNGGSSWTVTPGTEEQKGSFVPGAAIGQGVMTGMLDGQSTVFAWMEQLLII